MPKTTRLLEVNVPLERLQYLRELQIEADRRASLILRADYPTPGALAKAIDPETVQTPALDLIDAELAMIESGENDRLIVCMPPQEGKSTRVTTYGPLWMLLRNPKRRIMVISCTQDLADQFSRDIRDRIIDNSGGEDELDIGLRLSEDNAGLRQWRLDGSRGGIKSVGMLGRITGSPADAVFIDDPVVNMEQAQSTTYRERTWRVWQSAIGPRLAPGAPVVLVLTRWHEDDLAGKLLASPDGHRWRVLTIPAIAEKPDDPLGRAKGVPMISARGDRDWDAIRTERGEYVWAALYQQRPAPAEGGLFKRDKFRYWTHVDAPSLGRKALMLNGREVYVETLWKFLTVDLAISKKTSADYTAIGVWGITLDGDLVLLDMLRRKIGEDEHFANVNEMRSKWDAGTVFVEAAQHGTTMVYEAGRDGVPIDKLEADSDKFTRAIPASKRNDAGRLFIPSVQTYPWVQDYIDELAAFPNGAHDDMFDVTAYAARVAAAHWLPMETAEQERAREAVASSSDDYTDLMSVPL